MVKHGVGLKVLLDVALALTVDFTVPTLKLIDYMHIILSYDSSC